MIIIIINIATIGLSNYANYVTLKITNCEEMRFNDDLISQQLSD